MKENRVPYKFDQVSKVNEDVHPSLLQAGEVPLMTNMVLDKEANFRKPSLRGGTITVNSNALADPIFDVASLKDLNGDDWLLAIANKSLYASAGGTASWGSAIYTFSNTNTFLRYASFGTDVIFTADKSSLFRLYGGGFINSTDLELETPDVRTMQIQLENAVTAGANLDFLSNYMYTVVYVTDIGEWSNPSHPITFIRSSVQIPYSTDSDKSRLLLSNIPVPTDDRITRKLVI